MQPRSGLVWGLDGLHGTLLSSSADNPSQVGVRLDSGEQLLVPAEMLVRQQDGSAYLPLSPADIEPYRHQHGADEATLVVPVIEEEIVVQKQQVKTGKVRITKVVHEREVVVDEPLQHDRVEVERVPIERLVEEAVPVRYEGDTMIVPIMEEVLVVEKRWMLKEELHIRQQRIERHQPQRMTLRREEAHVEHINLREKQDKE
jgi:uncharacterized protein (TIGR02271 family)